MAVGLRLRGIDVLMAQQDGHAEAADDALIGRATELGRIAFSQDADLLRCAQQRLELGIPFSGIVFGHQLRVTIGACIRHLERLSNVFAPEDMANRVEFLPL